MLVLRSRSFIQLDRLQGLEGVQNPAELEHDGQFLGREEDLLLTGTRGVDVDGREDALVRDAPVELQLGVTGALELLEDDRVHG